MTADHSRETMQAIVDETKANLLSPKLRSIEPGDFDFEKAHVIDEVFFVIDEKGNILNTREEDAEREHPIESTRFLGSLSKPIIFHEAARILGIAGTSRLPVSKLVIKELLSSEFVPEYQKLNMYAGLNDDAKLGAGELKILRSKDIGLHAAKKVIIDRITNSLEEEVLLSLTELSLLTLSFSFNSPMDALKEVILSDLIKSGGTEDVNQRYLERMNSLCQGFEPTITTKDNYHWFQNAPNTGNLLVLAKFLRSKVQSTLASPVSQEDSLLSYGLTHGGDHGFDFTNSYTARDLKRRGMKVYEKVGWMPFGINWIRGLSEAYPNHQMLGSIVNIEKHGKVWTFVKWTAVELAMPKDSSSEEAEYEGSRAELQFPDQEGYVQYCDTVFAGSAKRFRKEFEQQVKDFFSSKSFVD